MLRWNLAVALVAMALFATNEVVADVVRVDAAPSRELNSFRPLRALGAGIDRLPRAWTDAMYDPANLKTVLGAGWGAVSYRLNTELHVEAWHWNPSGSWSDPAGRGYFTGSAAPAEAIRHSFGYPLPHRGYTRNEGTEEIGYSRLTDGDASSYWKSNPYLARQFTGENDGLFPQWIVIDLGTWEAVDTIGIDWGAPFARSYRVQFWSGQDAMRLPAEGDWHDFPAGVFARGEGGSVRHKLTAIPIHTRYVRVVMTDSSETCDSHGPSDRRNCVGYAIHEVFLGVQRPDGTFGDFVRHAKSQAQTVTQCSSVDPWHEPTDIETHGDQSGLDLFFTSGVTRGLPAMVPVAVLYGTPEDSAAEIAYLERRRYPISWVELGEEPDGQYMTPEHYAALYLQWASALHRVDANLRLGGPAFTGQNEDIRAWRDERGDTSWLGRFLRYLKAHGRLDDLAFLSFEHYPYDPCHVAWNDLYDEPKLISHIMQVFRDDGLPKNVPMFVTEVNIAWQSGQSFVDVFGALWLADYVGAFLSSGGAGSFYFHYLPHPLGKECDGTWGGFTMFKADARYRIEQPTSQYFATKILTQQWVEPGDGLHGAYAASSDVTDAAGRAVVTAYAVKRPDGDWATLLVNKDPKVAHAVRVVFRDGDSERSFSGPVSRITFGSDQYTWHPEGPDGRARPDGPPRETREASGKGATYRLPPASITVLRGKIQ
jgi:hypothetical protein